MASKPAKTIMSETFTHQKDTLRTHVYVNDQQGLTFYLPNRYVPEAAPKSITLSITIEQ